ncbi:MAG: hypothetical protein ACJ75J_04855 [Cytophagaceae bacterium]
MQTEKIVFARSRDFSEKLNATFDFVRGNFKGLFMALLYISGPFFLIGGILVGLGQTYLRSMGGRFNGSNLENIYAMGGYTIIGAIINWIALIMVPLVVYEYMCIYQEKPVLEEIKPGEVWDRVKKDFFMIFFTEIGYGLIVGLSFLLLIFPGIYMAVAVSFVLAIRIFERKGFFDSVSRSMDLIKDNWWATAGLLIVVGIIHLVLSMIIQIPVTIVTLLSEINALKDSLGIEINKVVYVSLFSLCNMGSNFLYCLSAIAVTFQYFNLVEKKDATGLLSRIDSIGKTPELKPENEESY